jgi:hypothetical protein
MRKLRLSLDDLAIDTFDPVPSRADEKGTVRGRAESEDSCFITDCGTWLTVDYTCEGWTCDNHTCDGAYDCPVTFDVTCTGCRSRGGIC